MSGLVDATAVERAVDVALKTGERATAGSAAVGGIGGGWASTRSSTTWVKAETSAKVSA